MPALVRASTNRPLNVSLSPAEIAMLRSECEREGGLPPSEDVVELAKFRSAFRRWPGNRELDYKHLH